MAEGSMLDAVVAAQRVRKSAWAEALRPASKSAGGDAWRDAWEHELRGYHGRWVESPGTHGELRVQSGRGDRVGRVYMDSAQRWHAESAARLGGGPVYHTRDADPTTAAQHLIAWHRRGMPDDERIRPHAARLVRDATMERIDAMDTRSLPHGPERALTREQDDFANSLAEQHGRVAVGPRMAVPPHGPPGTREMTTPNGHSYHVAPSGRVVHEDVNHSVDWRARG